MGRSSVIQIQELDGQNPRLLILTGPGLPFAGAAWTSALKVVTTWYPGNGAEATQQVLGPMEMPSDWEGMWRRNMLARCPCFLVEKGGSPRKVIQPNDLRQLTDDMFRSGSRLRVTWSTVSGTTVLDSNGNNVGAQASEHGQIVREGRATQWSYPIDRIEDIGWNVTFEWSSRGLSQQKVISTRENALESYLTAIGLEAGEVEAIDEKNSVRTKRKKWKSSTNMLSLGQLESLAAYPDALLKGFTRSILKITNDLARLGALLNKVRAIPAQLLNRGLALSQNTIAQANQFKDTLSRRSPEANIANARLADLGRSVRVFGQAHDQATLTARKAKEMANLLKKARAAAALGRSLSVREVSGGSTKDFVAVHIVKKGDTLASISAKYYVSPDNGDAIRAANKMSYADSIKPLSPGRLLVIPILNTGVVTGG